MKTSNFWAYALLLTWSVLGCAAVNREVAKDQYTLDLQGCIDHNQTRATQQACIAAVQATWTEAGSLPAAILDAGVQ